MRVSVVVFPGTNCEHDIVNLMGKELRHQVKEIWHRDTDLDKPDLVVVPGGFSYGDYLRTGALAKVSPIMDEVRKFADRGGPVIGICNGFQILCEARILPGALLENVGMKFLSRFVDIRVENSDTPFTRKYQVGDKIRCPIAHFQGNYFADPETIAELEGEGRVIFRYCAADGRVDANSMECNPNGSINSIAGICNQKRNVVGLMPHPERAAESIVANSFGDTGRGVFAAIQG